LYLCVCMCVWNGKYGKQACFIGMHMLALKYDLCVCIVYVCMYMCMEW
jgi:hypothetical protein